MRLPNGYGSVYKLSGKRRKPWTARITVGMNFDLERRKAWQKFRYLGFYATKSEALSALANYNDAPYDVDRRKMTVRDVWNEWNPIHRQNVKKFDHYDTAWKVLSGIADRRICDVKLRDIQNCMDESGKNTPSLRMVKSLVCLMWDYAVIHEIIPKDRRDIMSYLDVNKAGNPNMIQRSIFTTEEREKLWQHTDDPIAVMALMMLYTGLRVGELLALTEADIDMERRTINVRQSKTKAGIRLVPIADCLVPMVPLWLQNRHPRAAAVQRYYLSTLWPEGMRRLNMNHRTHDCRHTCVTLLTEAGVASEIRHAIIGHSTGDVEEKVYTHIQIDAMIEAINKIK